MMSEGSWRNLRRQQIPERQPFPHHPGNEISHLFLDIHSSDIVSSYDLVEVAGEILGRYVAMSAVGCFRKSIKRFRPVRPGAVFDVYRELAKWEKDVILLR